MLEYILENQILILVMSGLFALALTVYVGTIHFPSRRKKNALMLLELSTALLMISDALCYVYRGDTTTIGYYMVRICNCIVFLMILAEIYFLNDYITNLFMETGKFKRTPFALAIGYVLPLLGMALIIVSQFNGMYYFFDEFNRYTRGPLYPLSFVLPFASLIIQLAFSISNRKLTQERIIASISCFVLLPMTAAIAQLFIYGLSLINFSSYLAAALFFWSSLVDLNAQLLHSANTDFMTQLPNSYGFTYEVNKLKENSDLAKYNAYYFDISKMTLVNNRYGKDMGDKIIQSYAARVKSFLEKDEILARMGGNGFAALVKKENTNKFLDVLNDTEVSFMLRGFRETIHIKSVAGIYEIFDRRIEIGEIINNISLAVNYAKNIAKKPYIYMDKNLEEQINGAKLLQEKVLEALNKDEFEAFYQPKVNNLTNTICGGEALARWKKDGVYVSPFRFIPLLERDDSICRLDFIILEKVCSDIEKWLNQGIDVVPISVNFSRKNLNNLRLADDISAVISKYGIPRTLIQIEITETIDEFTIGDLKKFVDDLHNHNLRVAIDDFGTGSSTLDLLNNVNFDVLKIDKAFIDNLKGRSSKVLKSMLDLAKALDIETIAEGVELKEQCDLLKEMGCNQIQGYFFDKPLQKKEFEDRLIKKVY